MSKPGDGLNDKQASELSPAPSLAYSDAESLWDDHSTTESSKTAYHDASWVSFGDKSLEDRGRFTCANFPDQTTTSDASKFSFDTSFGTKSTQKSGSRGSKSVSTWENVWNQLSRCYSGCVAETDSELLRPNSVAASSQSSGDGTSSPCSRRRDCLDPARKDLFSTALTECDNLQKTGSMQSLDNRKNLSTSLLVYQEDISFAVEKENETRENDKHPNENEYNFVPSLPPPIATSTLSPINPPGSSRGKHRISVRVSKPTPVSSGTPQNQIFGATRVIMTMGSKVTKCGNTELDDHDEPGFIPMPPPSSVPTSRRKQQTPNGTRSRPPVRTPTVPKLLNPPNIERVGRRRNRRSSRSPAPSSILPSFSFDPQETPSAKPKRSASLADNSPKLVLSFR